MFSIVSIFLALVCYSEAGIETNISGTQMIMHQVKTLVCNADVNLRHYSGQLVAYQQWNQVYGAERNHSISKLQPIQGFNTKLKITLEKFDNNTSIYTSLNVYNASNSLQDVFRATIYCSGIREKMIILNDNYNRYEIDRTLSYVNSQNINFSCQQYSRISNISDVQIGWINTEGNKLFPYNQTAIVIAPTDQHNGSMLCCLYYTTKSADNVISLERFVKDKTMLIVRRAIPKTGCQRCAAGPTNGSDNSNLSKSSNTFNIENTANTIGNNKHTKNKTPVVSDTAKATDRLNENTTIDVLRKNKHTRINAPVVSDIEKATDSIENTANVLRNNKHTRNTTDVVSDTENITNAAGRIKHTTSTTERNTNNTNETDSDATNEIDLRQEPSNPETNAPISLLSIFAIGLLVAIIYALYAIKKRCWKITSRPQLPLPQIPRLQSQNEPNINTPFYVNLLFRRECEKEIQAQEEPQYEEVMYH